MEIRSILEADAEAFWECFDEIARAKRYFQFTAAPSLAGLSKYIANVVKAQTPLIVAVEQSEVVGWCEFSVDPSPNCGHNGYLAIALKEKRRGLGLGQRLFDACLAQCVSAGKIENLIAEVFTANSAAVSFYEKNGFTRVGSIADKARIDGNSFAVTIMTRKVRA